ncbi:MAG: UDP-N-acetylmuramoyl-tripeptide--D-alanyl-D-alanine ligase [Anaerotignaceae bacterium]
MKELTLKEIALAVNGRLENCEDENLKISVIATDTRTIGKGDLFVPFVGENFDGHTFIETAFEKGAVCVFSQVPTKGCAIFVEDTRAAFRDLSMYYLSLFNVKVVAITGSVGKTTTKDMIASVLEQKYSVLKTQGNFNNEIGLPKTIFNLNESHEVCVLEMGMNSFGEIEKLSFIAKPDIAVITNVGVSHIENLGSREGILKAKSEIFSFMKKDGVAILNKDNDLLRTLKLDFKTLWFGINEGDFYSNNIKPMGIEGIFAILHNENSEVEVKIPIPGEHMVLNALSAMAVGKCLGLNNHEIKKGIEAFVPTGMRMAIEKTKGGITIINDCYNANPVSMKAAIDVLADTEGRKVAILGDMFELGEYAQALHKEVGEYALEKNLDLVVCIGELSKNIYQACNKGNALYFETQEDFFEYGGIKKGDVCLVKASRGMHFEKTVEKLQEVE